MNLRQQNFVLEMLQHGNKVEAYRKAFHNQSANLRTVESAADRLLRKPEILEAISKTMDLARRQVEQDLKVQMKTQFLNQARKRELLNEIAEGEQLTQLKGTNNNPERMIYVQPSIAQRLRAMDMDSRLSGDYEEAKRKARIRPQDDASAQPPAAA